MRTRPASFSKTFLFTFFIGTYLYLLGFYFTHSSPSPEPITNNLVRITAPDARSSEKVVRVIDGDTFEIEGSIKVRLIGIDTPEMKNKNKTIDCFASEAKKKMESLISGKEVILEKDISETDKYGRLLRYVYIGDEMINNTLVQEGFAKTSTFPPDVKFKDIFLASERQARESKSGLWSACK